ncbi:MAG: isoprenylcysteine carboxylmethyltransferase family protein [Ignavibacteriae bacterium]|nr:isoprenylcysteine carboxylmethyltransferase family protein [Ignavibacteriota bacterium]
MDFRQRLFQYRSYTPVPFLILMVIFAQPTLLNLIIGFCVVLLGEFIRLWAVALAGSETRTTGPVGGTFLITRGPFAYVRNPLYLGNMLMYLGIGIMSMALFPWLPVVALIYLMFQYSLIVSLEEEYLLRAFGPEYVQYCESVPRFFPRLKKYSGGMDPQPELDWSRGLVSEKRTLQAIGLLTLVLVIILSMRG